MLGFPHPRWLQESTSCCVSSAVCTLLRFNLAPQNLQMGWTVCPCLSQKDSEKEIFINLPSGELT